MSKNLRRVIVTAAIAGGVAAMSPVAAQAKTVVPLEGGVSLVSCFGAPGTGSATVKRVDVNSETFAVTVPASAGVNYEFRARYAFTDALGRTVTTKAKTVDPASPNVLKATPVGAKNIKIFRIDVVNTLAEQLAYTSDPLGCD